MFQIKPTKPIKWSWSNCTAIGRKTDPNRYASVLIITKPIPIGSVTNLEKNRADRTVHTPTWIAGMIGSVAGGHLWQQYQKFHFCFG